MSPIFQIRPPFAVLAGLALAGSLAGCASVPDAGPRPIPVAPGAVAATQAIGPTTAAAWPGDDWWMRQGDAQLSALIEEGLSRAPDLAAALARLRLAEGVAEQAGAALLPSLDGQASVSLDKTSYENGFPEEFRRLMPRGFQDNGRIAVSAGYDLDLWGRNRAALAAARADVHLAAIDARQARLTLATAIAAAYADLGRLFAERDSREAAVTLREATARLVAQRVAVGVDMRGSQRLADAQAAAARADLVATEEALVLRRHQIAALVGQGPDRGLAIARPQATQLAPGLPDDVTTELVGRRGDVEMARVRVEGAARRVDVARADFYPAVNLSAMAGLQALGLGQLFGNDATFASVGPAISLPLFHGGALSGRYRAQRAAFDEAVADYDRVVLGAYQQVADAAASQRMIVRRLDHARQAVVASEEAYRIARLRYDGGLSTYLDVLQVEDRLLQARLAETNLAAAARAADIALIRALGGGFSAGPVSQTPVSQNQVSQNQVSQAPANQSLANQAQASQLRDVNR